jgi:hypothetical protein
MSDRTWYIKEMSRKLIEADAELHRTGYLDVEKLYQSLSFIRGESDLRSQALQDAIPHECLGSDIRHQVQLESELGPAPLRYRSNCDDNTASTASIGNIMPPFTFDYTCNVI